MQDSLGFWIPWRGFRILGTGFQSLSGELWFRIAIAVGFRIPGAESQSLSWELGFWIGIVSWIPDSLSCVPDSKAQDSDSTSKTFRIPLYGAIWATSSPGRFSLQALEVGRPHLQSLQGKALWGRGCDLSGYSIKFMLRYFPIKSSRHSRSSNGFLSVPATWVSQLFGYFVFRPFKIFRLFTNTAEP